MDWIDEFSDVEQNCIRVTIISFYTSAVISLTIGFLSQSYSVGIVTLLFCTFFSTILILLTIFASISIPDGEQNLINYIHDSIVDYYSLNPKVATWSIFASGLNLLLASTIALIFYAVPKTTSVNLVNNSTNYAIVSSCVLFFTTIYFSFSRSSKNRLRSRKTKIYHSLQKISLENIIIFCYDYFPLAYRNLTNNTDKNLAIGHIISNAEKANQLDKLYKLASKTIKNS